MTPEERQALREKHSLDERFECCWVCGIGGELSWYPCDVIKVLDATEPLLNVTPQPLIEPKVIKGSENLKSSDLKTKVENDHKTSVSGLTDSSASECDHRGPDGSYYGWTQPEDDLDYGYAYCPKCGEKL